MLTWHDLQSQGADVFIDWVHHTIFPAIERRFCSDRFEEAWQHVMFKWWENQTTADFFDSPEHVKASLVATIKHACTRRNGGNSCGLQPGIRLDGKIAISFGDLGSEGIVFEDSIPDRLPISSSGTIVSDRARDLWAEYHRLPPMQRLAVEMCVLGELTVGQAAELDGCSVNTMNQRRYQAIRRLRSFEASA